MIRKAEEKDIAAIAKIYEKILDREEKGEMTVGWQRGVYPTERTALESLARGTMFVFEDEGEIRAAAKIDREQVVEYRNCSWANEAEDSQVMVLHTLVVDPDFPRKGYGKGFVAFYEEYALEAGCPYLRMDTNAKNKAARSMYEKLGYTEAGIVSCKFNGIEGVELVCLEKKL